MAQTRKISPSHIIAGVLFAVLAVFQLISFIDFMVQTSGYNIPILNVLLSAQPVGIYVLTAVGLFVGGLLDRRSAPARALPLIGLGATALWALVSFFRPLFDFVSVLHTPALLLLLYSLPKLMSFAGCAALFVFAASMPARKPKSWLRMLWFLPGLLVLISYFTALVIGAALRWLHTLALYSWMFRIDLSDFLYNSFFSAAILLAGLGCAYPAVPEEKRAEPLGASGEEFDGKKKQLLDL